MIPSDGLFVDHHKGMVGGGARGAGLGVVDLDHDGCLRGRDVVGGRRCGLGEFGLQSRGLLFDDYDHEDDDENEENVNQGSDVHLGSSRKRATACRGESHTNFLSSSESEMESARACLESLDTRITQRVPHRSDRRRWQVLAFASLQELSLETIATQGHFGL